MPLTTLTTQRPVRIVNAGDSPGIIINRDITNTIVYAFRAGFDPLNEGSLIDPLTYAPYDGTTDVWAATATGTATVDVSEGRTNYVPSPAQQAAQLLAAGVMKDTTGQTINTTVTGVAKDTTVNLVNTTLGVPAQDSIRTAIPANIAATGVPLINLKSATTAATGQAIAAGATFTPAAITGINQPAYNLHLTGTAGASSTKPWYTVTVKWIDTASGFIVQFDQFSAFMSSVSNALSTVIYGPADADQMQIAITNNDTVGMTLNTAYVIISSRVNYTADSMYQFWSAGGNMPSVPTFQIAASAPVPAQKILFSLSRTVGIGVTTTPDYSLPGYAGQVAIGFVGVSSNNWDVVFTEQFTGTIMYRILITSANVSYALFQFPRAPVTVHVTNNGTVLGTINLEVVGL